MDSASTTQGFRRNVFEELKRRQSDLVVKKKAIEMKLSGLKQRFFAINQKLAAAPPAEYFAISKRIGEFKVLATKMDQELSGLRAELRPYEEERRNAFDAALDRFEEGRDAITEKLTVSDVNGGGRIIERLAELQTKYLAFAEDPTRVNSMRLMAAEFARELTCLLSEQKEEVAG